MNTLPRSLSGTANVGRLQAGLSIVRKVLSANATGLTTRELYRLSLQEKAATPYLPKLQPRHAQGGVDPLPPHPEHPIHSMTYLKRTVMPMLEQRQECKKVHIARTYEKAIPEATNKAPSKSGPSNSKTTKAAPAALAWVWKTVENPHKNLNAVQWPKKVPFGTDVGVGEDWSHLNKRRQRARGRKVTKAVESMKIREVQKVIQVQRVAAAQQTKRKERQKQRYQLLLQGRKDAENGKKGGQDSS